MSHLGKGMIAGFVATVILSALMLMKNIASMLGGMMGGSPAMGWAGHFVIGTVIWGALFALVEPQLPGSSPWLKGVVFGMGAWVLMMLMVMPMAGAGLFGMKMGVMAPMMTAVLHAIFGAVLGSTYGALLGSDSRSPVL